MKIDDAITKILAEACRAQSIHPRWPKDVVHQCAIVCEESGEATQASLDYSYHGKPRERIRDELIQTAATCLRALTEGEL